VPDEGILGPAELAFAGPSRLWPATGPGTVALPVTDERVHDLLARVTPEEAGECGLAGVTSAVHAVIRDGQVVAAAGYTTWPGRVAHLSVLTDPAHRGQGLAAPAGSAAAADALAAGLLAQWRARVPASIAASVFIAPHVPPVAQVMGPVSGASYQRSSDENSLPQRFRLGFCPGELRARRGGGWSRHSAGRCGD
jgi:GNAT acetyltransferase